MCLDNDSQFVIDGVSLFGHTTSYDCYYNCSCCLSLIPRDPYANANDAVVVKTCNHQVHYIELPIIGIADREVAAIVCSPFPQLSADHLRSITNMVMDREHL